MKPPGTRGGLMGDDELPPLDPRLKGLRGPELLRAALRLHRPDPPSRTRPASPVAPRPLGGPRKAIPVAPPTPAWTPHDAIPQQHAQAHWADDVPLPDEPPEEEDWR